MGGQIMSNIYCGAVLGLFALVFLVSNEAAAQGDIQAGAKLFKEHKCIRCHGESGKGDGPTAKKLKGKVEFPDFTNKAVMATETDEFFAQIIAKGGKAVQKSSTMPSFGDKLNEEQIHDLIAYIRTFAH
jgi:cytochrome c oxidase cbb3-type subunit 3